RVANGAIRCQARPPRTVRWPFLALAEERRRPNMSQLPVQTRCDLAHPVARVLLTLHAPGPAEVRVFDDCRGRTEVGVIRNIGESGLHAHPQSLSDRE